VRRLYSAGQRGGRSSLQNRRQRRGGSRSRQDRRPGQKDENFDTYELPRFSWLPKIETVLVDNPALPPQGCGEPAITPMGAVIANAVYDAAGVRLYELPMTAARVKKAIS
jgi:CO/xanthine dehydrogenase Mo-binding subunit